MNLKKISKHIKMYNGRKFKMVNGLLNQVEMKSKKGKLYSRPISITIETTNRCVFRCEMCPRSADKVRKIGDMTLETFHKIEPFLNGALHVNLSGFGDTLLNKDLFQMLKIIKSHNCYAMVYTNGYLLTKDICEGIINNSLDEMVISIDGASRQTYEEIRKNGDFNLLINNIDILNELKSIKKSKYPILNINFMAMDKNIKELPGLVDLAYQHNFKNIYVDNIATYTKEMSDHSLFNHIDLANLYFKNAEKKAKDLGIGISVPCFDYQQNSCHDPFMTMYITWDGKITNCANQSFIMGDLDRTDIKDIWNNSKYQELRRSLIENHPPEQCENCFLHVIKKENFIDYPQKLIQNGLEGRIRYDL